MRLTVTTIALLLTVCVLLIFASFIFMLFYPMIINCAHVILITGSKPFFEVTIIILCLHVGMWDLSDTLTSLS